MLFKFCKLKETYLSSKSKLDTKSLILKFQKIHGNDYDYSKVVFESLNSKVIIICPKHGEYIQQPRLHLRGSNGCRLCNKKKKRKNINFYY